MAKAKTCEYAVSKVNFSKIAIQLILRSITSEVEIISSLSTNIVLRVPNPTRLLMKFPQQIFHNFSLVIFNILYKRDILSTIDISCVD
jgi:hypothetical protein